MASFNQEAAKKAIQKQHQAESAEQEKKLQENLERLKYFQQYVESFHHDALSEIAKKDYANIENIYVTEEIQQSNFGKLLTSLDGWRVLVVEEEPKFQWDDLKIKYEVYVTPDFVYISRYREWYNLGQSGYTDEWKTEECYDCFYHVSTKIAYVSNLYHNRGEERRFNFYEFSKSDIEQIMYLSFIEAAFKLKESQAKNTTNSQIEEPNPSNNQSGCYIATSIYGSYDCSEVWVLRRFRDQVLKKSLFGKGFVIVYYRLSPKLVKYFGSTKLFQVFFKRVLDAFVHKLKKLGYLDNPYIDK